MAEQYQKLRDYLHSDWRVYIHCRLKEQVPAVGAPASGGSLNSGGNDGQARRRAWRSPRLNATTIPRLRTPLHFHRRTIPTAPLYRESGLDASRDHGDGPGCARYARAAHGRRRAKGHRRAEESQAGGTREENPYVPGKSVAAQYRRSDVWLT